MMMSGTTTSSNLNVNVNIFTAAQWEELEQQALIYKYMVSGVPVPSDLLLSVRRSLYNSTFSSSSSLSNHQHNLGIREGSYQYNQLYHQIAAGGVGGYGRKIDLEPGRCRRTDGKKWRCAKEAYPDSKYCERHMHRGRNRSRKPVEFSNSSSVSSVSSVSSTTINVSSSPSISISKSIDTTFPSFPSISISKSIDTTFPSFPSIQTNLHDYRYLQGMKELGEDFHHQNYSHFNFENLKNHQQSKNEETQGGQHCFVMGTDFIKSSSEETNKSNIQTDTKPFHHFFAPPKTTPNPNPDSAWVEVDHLINPPKSPLSTQDLFQSKPRPYW